MARAARLLQLVQLLRRYRVAVSAEVLAESLGVSVRSVYRDIATLREQGASIEGAAGIGYLLRPGFLLPPLMFTDEELEALVLGLRLVHEHADPALGAASLDVVAKLRAVLPRDLRHTVDEVPLLAGPARARVPDRIDLAVVRRSVREGRKARIRYEDKRGEASSRVIWPLAVAFFEQVRVVVAWCETRRDFRTFRVDRIAGWASLADRVPKPRLALLREWREREGIPAQVTGDVAS